MSQYEAAGPHADTLPIMVVEDDAAILDLLCEELQDAGYSTWASIAPNMPWPSSAIQRFR